ncbi:hypothetical protein FHS31_000030 [Sphingomonas vulcanisoli]|uniref:Gamma-glutamylcyclotransferase AIG2-like domain-containing protein n=1 Tax=Sphingomonas vulcanisoli TaxID=1658060 RepID=A0ABX0TLP5_9SPHN|nr:gamma-glutamylcyclotransferase family protein [Sphingomonas vulcanisoli]NIJ06448.1 hypothetical protein [Sphingomonas vulcanisoli]
MTRPHRLFSYGTLRDPTVQQGLFGRQVDEAPDALVGWKLGTVLIEDDGVVGLSGLAEHWILRHSGDPADRVAGVVLAISDAELAIADRYETNAYVRVAAQLASGGTAFVYVDAADPASVAAGDRLG